MNFFRNVLKGIAIGAAAIIPGFSGGVLATVMGIYEPLMSALSGFFKDVKKNFLFLLPFILGGAIGLFAIGKLILALMTYFENASLFLFSGLVLGSMPSLFSVANSEGFKKSYLVAAFIAFFAAFLFAELSKIPIQNDFLRFFAGGAVYSFGSIVPGVSASFMLINMGIYKSVIDFFSTPLILIPFLLGFILMSILLIRSISYLFKRFHGYAYYSAAGLLLASILSAFPPVTAPLIDIPVFLVSLLIGFFFIKP